MIDWYDGTAADIVRTVMPSAADEFALMRWAAHGYETDLAALGDAVLTQLNERDLTDLEQPVLPDGFRFRTADEAGLEAAASRPMWTPVFPSTYTAEGYEGVRQTAAYRGDLHILVEAPDGTMASSTIMWLDEANKTAEFEPVGTHPGYRRLGLGRAMLLHGMHLARRSATHMTVACLGAPGHPQARGLYYVGFREVTRDALLIKTMTAGRGLVVRVSLVKPRWLGRRPDVAGVAIAQV